MSTRHPFSFVWVFVSSVLWGLPGRTYCQAQAGLTVEAYGEVGHLVIRQSDQTSPPTRPLWAAELTLSRQTTGQTVWQRAHGLPQMGLTLQARNLGNEAVYGYDFSLVPFLEFNAWTTKHAILQIKHGTGIGYVSKQYDVLRNPGNQLVSTTLNAVSLLNVGLLLRGRSSVAGKVGVEVNHKSNGNLRQPNEGLNSGMLYAGLRYYLSPKRLPVLFAPVERHRHDWRAYVGTAAGLYRTSDTGIVIAAAQLELLAMFQHDIRFRAVGGFEYMAPNGPDRAQLSLKIGEEVLFGDMGIRYQVGTYLYKAPGSGLVFQKVGIAYYPLRLENHVARSFSVGTSLKAHGLRAAFIEVNAGYVF